MFGLWEANPLEKSLNLLTDKSTKQSNLSPFGENREDKLPNGTDLTFQGVGVPLGGFFF
jgi:hypothetical protein